MDPYLPAELPPLSAASRLADLFCQAPQSEFGGRYLQNEFELPLVCVRNGVDAWPGAREAVSTARAGSSDGLVVDPGDANAHDGGCACFEGDFTSCGDGRREDGFGAVACFRNCQQSAPFGSRSLERVGSTQNDIGDSAEFFEKLITFLIQQISALNCQISLRPTSEEFRSRGAHLLHGSPFQLQFVAFWFGNQQAFGKFQ